jgi:hypothetical protein
MSFYEELAESLIIGNADWEQVINLFIKRRMIHLDPWHRRFCWMNGIEYETILKNFPEARKYLYVFSYNCSMHRYGIIISPRYKREK